MAYSLREMFIIGQNVKHVHINFSFHEHLVFFWLIRVTVNTYYTKEILYVNTHHKWWHKNKDMHAFSPVSDVNVGKSCFYNCEVRKVIRSKKLRSN